MKRLDQVIRLGRWKLDEERRKLADLEAMEARFADQRARLEAEIAAETALAAGSAEARATLPAYLAEARERARRIEASLLETRREIALTREAIEAAFGEVKSFEIAQAEQDRRAARALARREQQRLDAVALDLHRRTAAPA